MLKTIGVLSACVLSAAMLGGVMAEAQSDGSAPSVTNADEAEPVLTAELVRQKLREPITITLENVNLTEALESIFEKKGLEFDIDKVDLEAESISLDGKLVNCRLKNVTVRAGLQKILSPHALGWVCDDAGVRILSRQSMCSKQFARVYDVSELLDSDSLEIPVIPPPSAPSAEPPGEKVSAISQAASSRSESGASATSDASPIPPYWCGTGLLMSQAPVDPKREQEDTLVQIVRQITGGAPDGPWMEMDGEGGSVMIYTSKASALLVVRQNELVHAEIEDLLNDMISRQGEMEAIGTSGPLAKSRPDVSRRPVVRVLQRQSSR